MKSFRSHYIDKIANRRHNGLVKILTGIRRCGKSYLLSVLYKDYLLQQGVSPDHIIEVPLDRDDFKDLRDAIRLGEYVRGKIISDGQWNYVFIDEVQLTRRILPPDEARRWEVKGKKYFDYPLKYYCEDNGLRNARLDFRDVEPSHAMESVIYNELLLRGCQVDVGVVTVADRQHEIDFVVNRAPGKLYIQVALELPTAEKREQELLPLRKCDDFFRKMIIVKGSDPLRFTGDGIMQVGVIPFLLDEAILDKALSD